jgi:glutathione S-transferase
MRKLWGRANSSNVMKTIWLLEELALPYDRIDVGGAFGRTHDADYLAMNPNSMVPTLQEENGFTLWESNVILRYLAAAHAAGTPIWPEDLQARANIDRWMDWQQTTITAPGGAVFTGLVRTPAAQRDMPAIAAAVVKLGDVWSILDRQLAKHAYVAGPDFTIADIPVGVHVHRWFSFDVERPAQPNLRAWYDRLLARPAYRDHCAGPMS